MTDFSMAVVRPGDTLLVCVGKPLTDAAEKRLVEQAGSVLPGVRVAVVEDVTGLAVYRPASVEEE